MAKQKTGMSVKELMTALSSAPEDAYVYTMVYGSAEPLSDDLEPVDVVAVTGNRVVIG